MEISESSCLPAFKSDALGWEESLWAVSRVFGILVF